MAYVDSLLADGERVVRRAHQHWFIMVWHARWAVAALVVAVVGGFIKLLNLSDSGPLMFALGWLVLILLLVGLVTLGWGWIVYQNTEFAITSRRIIQATGVINKRASDSSLEMINDAILTESIFGRLFGFGDLEVLTASEAGIERLRMLTDAKEFKKAMLDAKQEYEAERSRPTTPPLRADAPSAATYPAAGAAPAPGRAAPTAGIGTPQEVADAVARLGELRDKGLVTPEEFEAKKRELLARL
jgi:uncharacterized membrane protein YdbT with pleckstrin-like domain